jgi:DNA-binding response OmpR family regulator
LAHVLIVEDSPLAVDALRVLFEETGHRVTVATTVVQAIVIAREEHPDIMLLDLGLPDGDGLDVMTALRADGSQPVTFALTGTDDAAVTKRCIAAGCREVLVKPVRPRTLLEKVESVDVHT